MTKEFKQQVRMAAVQVSGLSAEELKAALAYEVEPFSGIPAAEAEVKFTSVPETDESIRVYEVTVTQRKRGGAAFSGELERYLKPAIIFAALVILALAADFACLYFNGASLKSEIAKREPLDQEINRIKNDAQRMRNETAALRAKRAAEAKAQEEVAAKRSAYPQAFAAIARAFGEKAVLKSFTAGDKDFTMEITAFAVSSEAASAAMTALDAEAKKIGWKFASGEIDAMSGAGTTLFRCKLWK